MSKHHPKSGDPYSTEQQAAQTSLNGPAELLAAYIDAPRRRAYGHQPQVALVVVGAKSHTICAVSENCQQFLGAAPSDLLSQHLKDVLSASSYERFKALSQVSLQQGPQRAPLELRLGTLAVAGTPLDALPDNTTLDNGIPALQTIVLTLHYLQQQELVDRNRNDTSDAPAEGHAQQCDGSSTAPQTDTDVTDTTDIDVIVLAFELTTATPVSVIESQQVLNYLRSADSLARLYS
ncbi:MAG: hypothetical protein AAF708_19765, partial [Deinococcota bacterium]